MKTYLVLEKAPAAHDMRGNTIDAKMPVLGEGYPITVVKADDEKSAVEAVMKVTRRMGVGYAVAECSFLSFTANDVPSLDDEGILSAEVRPQLESAESTQERIERLERELNIGQENDGEFKAGETVTTAYPKASNE